MGFTSTQYAAAQQDIELRTALVMDQLNKLTIFPPLENGDVADNAKDDKSVSRPPSPPDSGTTTPRLTLQPCPSRLKAYFPPPNYGCVDTFKVYRSSYPQDRHVDFVKSLGIKTVLTLVETNPTFGFDKWLETDDIKWAKLYITPNKDKTGKVDTSIESICEALLFIMDSSNYPVYVHCNQGKHRTGCVIACLRKIQGWPITEIIREYNVYAGEKSRPGDRALIEAFDPKMVYSHAKEKGILDGNNGHHDPDRGRRHDSTITDIDSLRAALDAGLLGALDFPSDRSSSTPSSGTLSPNDMSPPLDIESGRVGAGKMESGDYVEDIRIVASEGNGMGQTANAANGSEESGELKKT